MKKLLSSILAVLMAAALVVTGGFTGFAAASAEQPVLIYGSSTEISGDFAPGA